MTQTYYRTIEKEKSVKLNIKITYEAKDHAINDELDKKAREAMRKIGAKEWASGMDMEKWVRDLAFELE